MSENIKMWRWVGLDSLIGGGERKILRTPVLPERNVREPVVSPEENLREPVVLPTENENVDLKGDIKNNFDFKTWRWVDSEALTDGSGGASPYSSPSSSSSSSSSSMASSQVTLPPDFNAHEYMEKLVKKMSDDPDVEWSFDEITGALSFFEGLPEWFAKYLVNDHLVGIYRSRVSLFRRLLEHIDNAVFYDLVLMETKNTIQSLLKEMTRSRHPRLKRSLNNLRHWLGVMTYGMNRPLPKSDTINFKIDTYNTKDQQMYYA